MTEAAPDPDWIAARQQAAARALRRAVSAVDLSHHRAGLGWTVRPAPGAFLASVRQASWDPEPDYFHHWVRDAGIALAAVPAALAAEPGAGAFWRRAVAEHVAFSAAISDPERRGPAVNPLSATAAPEFRRFLRPDAELAGLRGADWRGEPRVAADGSPDLERWNRPQDDGPALRARAMMDLAELHPEMVGAEGRALIAADLDHSAEVAGRACYGPWEEPPMRRTSYTLIVQWDALDRGARLGGPDAERLGRAAERVMAVIAQSADPATGGWRESIEAAPGVLDSATVLAILHAGREEGPLAIHAPRTRATVTALEALFARLYPINAGRAVPAMGRFAGDAFFGGNPWYPVTLGFAELHYRMAARGDGAAWERAEAWMALVQQVAPEGDDLPEQFDRETGAPVSCLGLTWSAAAFLGAAAARQAMASR